VSLFKITVSREIRGFNNILNLFKSFDVESGVLTGCSVAVMLAYDGLDEGGLNT